tara:strand:- start:3183 stop:3536 length:354 start_codon:yes stop_codon:yes gene_type:complete
MNPLHPHQLSPKELHRWLGDNSISPVLIDVREEEELVIASFPSPVLHLPLSQSDKWIGSLSDHFAVNKPVVVFCHAGIRSWNFGTWLLKKGLVKEVWNLDGGIDAWSLSIDSSVPRY